MKKVTHYGIEIVWFNGVKDFEKYLNFLVFNRPYGLSKPIVKSMNHNSWLGTIIILETDVIDGIMRYYIIDGQHRVLCASYLNIPFAAHIYSLSSKNIKTKKDIVDLVALMHRTHKGWSIKNYVRSYSLLGDKNYAIFNNFIEKHKITAYSSAGAMLAGCDRTIALNNLKDGSFKVNSLELAEETITLSKRFTNMTGNGRLLEGFHNARLKIDNFNMNKFKINYEANQVKLRANRRPCYCDTFVKYAI